MKPRLYILFLIYGKENLDSGIHQLQKLVNKLFQDYEVSYLVVDNSIIGDVEEDLTTGYTLISGDNTCREFSGWDKAVEWLKKVRGLNNQDVLIFANDTFHRNYGDSYLSFFKKKIVSESLKQDKIIGYVDGYPSPITIFGLNLQFWIRTSLFMGKWEQLKQLMPLTVPEKLLNIFSEDPKCCFKHEVDLSENYQDYLKTWLVSGHNPESDFKEIWHSQERLMDNFEGLKEKAKCILCEHYFSARAYSQKVDIAPVNLRKSFHLN